MLTPAKIQDWHDYYEKARFATFFQSPQWSQIWASYRPGKYVPSPFFAHLPGGKRVLIPLTKQRATGGFNHLWHAAPAGTYGNWLNRPDENLTEEEIILLIQQLFKSFPSLILRLSPFFAGQGAPDESIPKVHSTREKKSETKTQSKRDETYAPGPDKDSLPKRLIHELPSTLSFFKDNTHMIDCSNGIEPIRKKWEAQKGSMKRKINKAVRSGITLKKAVSEEDLDAYYRIYLENSKKWSPPPSHVYEYSFFSLLMQKNIPCEIWLAEKEGNAAAGAVIFTGKNHQVYWHGASSNEYHAFRPVNLLISTLIEQCCKNSIDWFDFNPSQGIRGVEAFKKSFGSIVLPAPALYRYSRTLKGLQKVMSILKLIKKRRT